MERTSQVTPIEWLVATQPVSPPANYCEDRKLSIRVLDVLRRHGPMSAFDIGLLLGVHADHARRGIRWAVEHKQATGTKKSSTMIYAAKPASTRESGPRTQLRTVYARIREQSKDLAGRDSGKR